LPPGIEPGEDGDERFFGDLMAKLVSLGADWPCSTHVDPVHPRRRLAETPAERAQATRPRAKAGASDQPAEVSALCRGRAPWPRSTHVDPGRRRWRVEGLVFTVTATMLDRDTIVLRCTGQWLTFQ
jgi:hypothetical protein